MLGDERLEFGDRFGVTHKLEFSSRRDQVIDHDVSISASANELGASFTTKAKGRNCAFMEGELVGELESRR